MSLYEVVLRKPDGADEVRFTDHALSVDQTLLIGGSRWTIVRLEPAEHPLAIRRYLCVPALHTCATGLNRRPRGLQQ